jgi:lysophospholipid acyltransferase (LPLAT)-like uncharacterized protein
MSKDEVEKEINYKNNKKIIWVNTANSQNLRLGSWDQDNSIKRKSKQIMK